MGMIVVIRVGIHWRIQERRVSFGRDSGEEASGNPIVSQEKAYDCTVIVDAEGSADGSLQVNDGEAVIDIEKSRQLPAILNQTRANDLPTVIDFPSDGIHESGRDEFADGVECAPTTIPGSGNTVTVTRPAACAP